MKQSLALCLVASSLWFLAGCAAMTESTQSYTVVKGDTLWSIAYAHHVDWQDVARWNNLSQPYTVYVGQKLAVGQPRSTAGRGSGSASHNRSKPETMHSNWLNPSPLRTKPTQTAKASTAPAASSAPAPAKSSNTSSSSAQLGARPAKATPAPQVTAQKSSNSKPAPQQASKPIQPAQPQGKLSWQWPLQKSLVAENKPKPTRHGINLYAQQGATIRASAGGKIVYSGDGLEDFGDLVIIQHNDEYLSAYSYLQNVTVREGDTVKAGQPIAKMGLGPGRKAALHFEVRRSGNQINPSQVLPKI